MKILIVDDSKMIRHMTISILNELGYDNVVESSNVIEAKHSLSELEFDLVISDWHMPGESGLDFLKYMKSHPEYASIPFVLQTTENEKKNIFEAVKSGIQGYLYKPVQKSAIAKKLLELSKAYHFKPPTSPDPVRIFKPLEPLHEKPAPKDNIDIRPPSNDIPPLSKQSFGYTCELQTTDSQPLYIAISENGIGDFPDFIAGRYPESAVVLLHDSQAENTYGKTIAAIKEKPNSYIINIPDPAANRTISQCGMIIDTISGYQLTTSTVIIAMGSTPLLHTAGFTAAIFLGGVRLVTLPCALDTLLDTSTGGIWSINGSSHSDMASIHLHPSVVWFDINSFIDSPNYQTYCYRCADIYRYAFIGGSGLSALITDNWEALLKKNPPTIAELICSCLHSRIIIEHSIEINKRRYILKFGQQLATAIQESAVKHPLQPGQAIYRALACLIETARQTGSIEAGTMDAFIRLIQLMPAFKMPEPLNPGKVFKSAFESTPTESVPSLLALPTSPGNVTISPDIPRTVLIEVMKSLLSEPSDK